jgi:hypothetical protein
MVASLLKVIYSGAEDDRLGCTRQPKERLQKYISGHIGSKQGRATTQWNRLDFISTPDFGKQCSVILSRKGHFIRRIFLVTTLPDLDADRAALGAVTPRFGYTNSVGHALIQDATVTIGGAPIDTLNGRLMEVLDEAYTPLDKVQTVNRLIGRSDTNIGDGIDGKTLYIPLPFWFTSEDARMALPIDAIAMDEVRLTINMNALAGLYYTRSRTADGSALASLDAPQYYTYDEIGVEHPELYIPPEGADPQQYTRRIVTVGTGHAAADYHLGDTYILAEYIYVDSPEANRFRLADLEIPIIQHEIITPYETNGRVELQIPIRMGNPAKTLRFYVHNDTALQYNSYFDGTRECVAVNQYGPAQQLWWPDAVGLGDTWMGTLQPAFVSRQSEPLNSIQLRYQGQLLRYSSVNPVQFRSILPLLYGDVKTAWHHRYYYMIPFGECGVNADKIEKMELELQLSPIRGQLSSTAVVPAATVYLFAETMNILRIFGGRAGLLF